MPRIGMIWAQTLNGAIGRDGDMPWHLPEDLAHFKATTLGKPVIMGRRTWESLPVKFRPLPGRANIVVTRNPSYAAEGALVVPSLEAALELLARDPQQTGRRSAESRIESRRVSPSSVQISDKLQICDDVDAWIMGGGELYREGMQYADLLTVTQILTEVLDADTFAPEITAQWHKVDSGEVQESASGLRFLFERYARA